MDIPKTQFLNLPNDRKVAYAEFGSPSSQTTLFYFHGFPSCHVEALGFQPTALKHNVRIISITRPGYGQSTDVPNRTLLDWPDDVLNLADHLKVQRFGVMGVSGGGPYAFACLKKIPPERLIAAGIVCGMYPATLGLSGMLMSVRMLLNVSAWAPSLVAWISNWQMGKIKAAEEASKDGDGLEDFLNQEMKNRPAVDVEVWRNNEGGFRDALVAAVREMMVADNVGQAMGHEGYLLGNAWGFDLGDLDIGNDRVVMWHGTEDGNCPLRMAEESVKILGDGAELRIAEGEAHVSLVVRKADEIIATMKEMMTR